MANQNRNLTSIVSSTTFNNSLTNLNTDNATVGADDQANGKRSIRVATQDPSGTLTGMQTVTIRHRWLSSQNSQNVANRFDVVLAGSSTVLYTTTFTSMNMLAENNPPTNSSMLMFDASVIPSANGAPVEFIVTLNTGSASNGGALIYMVWNAQYTEGTIVRRAPRTSYFL